MRKLASIRKIADIRPIPDADAIEVAVVDGWKVVVKKGEYSVGDLAVYLEIDAWVPHALAPFLSKGQEPREYNGVTGERLRTVKLRGQVSQGLLLPLRTVFAEWTDENFQKNILEDEERVGDDLTEALGIQKWEAPISPQLAGQVRGVFPTGLIPKTDQERADALNATTHAVRRPTARDFTVYAMYPQTWGSTALGHGGIGGASMSTAYTVVLECMDTQEYLVYFGSQLCYTVSRRSDNLEKFKEDIMNQCLASKHKSGKYQ